MEGGAVCYKANHLSKQILSEKGTFILGAKVNLNLTPAVFLTAFPFGPWLSTRLYVMSKDYFSTPFVIASEKLKVTS